jgi:hypothetical protein
MYTVLEVREKATWRFDHGSRIPSEGRVFTALCPKHQQQSAWQPGGTPLLLWRYSWFFKWLKDEVEYTGARKRNPEGAASWLYLEGRLEYKEQRPRLRGGWLQLHLQLTEPFHIRRWTRCCARLFSLIFLLLTALAYLGRHFKRSLHDVFKMNAW